MEEHNHPFPEAGWSTHSGEVPAWCRVGTAKLVLGHRLHRCDRRGGRANGRARPSSTPPARSPEPGPAATASVTLHPGDTAVIDLGQNLVGVPRYTVRGLRSAQVVCKPGRCSTTTARAPTGPVGSVYHANLRSARATSTYVLKETRPVRPARTR
ncbi:family 78 glycoside hydrolase catalytic domain [Streptomyces sp. L7]